MRITVGGVLLLSGIGAFAFWGPLQSLNFSVVDNQLSGLKDSGGLILENVKARAYALLGRSPEQSVPSESTPLVPIEEPQSEVPPVVPVVPAEIVSAPAPEKLVSTPSTTPTPKKKRSKKRRARKAVAPVAVAKAAPVAPSQPVSKAAVQASAGTDKLIGTYVALKLKSGRDVKGILDARNAKEYTLTIPGMGPFQYPAENVVSVTSVE